MPFIKAYQMLKPIEVSQLQLLSYAICDGNQVEHDLDSPRWRIFGSPTPNQLFAAVGMPGICTGSGMAEVEAMVAVVMVVIVW